MEPIFLSKVVKRAKNKEATIIKLATSSIARKAFAENMKKDWFKPLSTASCPIRASFLGYDK